MKPNLNDLLKLFLGLDIEFVIVGGFAAALHGSSMVTKDLDLCFLLTPEKIDKLRASLAHIHPKLRITPQKLSFLEHPETNEGFKNLYLETDLGIVDIVSNITGVGNFDTVLAAADTIALFGHEVRVMSIQQLITSKRSIGRAKDIAVAKELEAILRSQS